MTELFTFDNLESDYDCAHASQDLPRLKAQLDTLRTQAGSPAASSQGIEEQINRLENQIHFIKAKCSIPG